MKNKNNTDKRSGLDSWFESRHSAGLIKLTRIIDYSPGFNLIIIEHNNVKYRDRIINHLESLYPYSKSRSISLKDAPPFSNVEEELFSAESQTKIFHLISTGSYENDDTWNNYIQGFNSHRELIAEKCKFNIVLWLSKPDIALFSKIAPDMWSWRAAVIDFNNEIIPEKYDRELTNTSNFGNDSFNKRMDRITEIEDYIVAKAPSPNQKAILLNELGRLYKSIGKIDKALTVFKQAFAIYDENDDRKSKAVTLGDIARIKMEKGDIDEALKLFEGMVQVFDKLGDTRSKSIVPGDIARIKFDKGEIDEALKLYHKIIQIFDTLGDTYKKAMILGDIAHIKVSKGQLDEALELYQYELGIYDKLGVIGSRATTLSDMANIHLQKGDTKKAYEYLSESYQINIKLGRLDGICNVGIVLGLLLCQKNQKEEGLKILKRSRDGFEKSGKIEFSKQARELINEFGTD